MKRKTRMNRTAMRILAAAVLLAACGAGAAERPYMVLEVTGSRVNLRAKPSLDAEVVGQVEPGELLYAKSLGVQWAEVAPPKDMTVWVHREFIENGLVTASTLNLRAGAGINYSVVGELPRGFRVSVRETFGEWFRIAAPPSVSLWVSRDYLREVEPLGAGPVTIMDLPALPVPTAVVTADGAAAATGTQRPEEGSPTEAATPTVPPAAPLFAPPTDLDLIPLAGQGQETRVQGILLRVGFGFGRPSGFRLVGTGPDGESGTLCYVRGNSEQLRGLLNREMLLVGREYWVRNSTIPVVVPERILLPEP